MVEASKAGIYGRSGPLRRLGDAMSASAQGRRSAALVSGEAGIGKTSLVRAAIDVSAVDAVVGWGTCWHGEGAPGFWPWMQVFGDLFRSVGADAAVAAAGHDRDTLSVLVRDLGPAARPPRIPIGTGCCCSMPPFAGSRPWQRTATSSSCSTTSNGPTSQRSTCSTM